jgi:hypothetical protein
MSVGALGMTAGACLSLASSAQAVCPWDCDGSKDGIVGVNDFLALLAQWGQVGTSCDFDGAGAAITDFLELLAHWGDCPDLCLESYVDDFEDGVLDSRFFSSGGCGSPVETSGQLRLDVPTGCEGGNKLMLDGSQQTICGDFDVSVDFVLYSFPVPPSAYQARATGMQVQKASDESFVATIERYNIGVYTCYEPAAQSYKAWTTNSDNCAPYAQWAATTDMQGKFRITRTGATLGMYYLDSGWQLLKQDDVTDEDLVLAFFSWQFGDTAGQQVAFDNLSFVD